MHTYSIDKDIREKVIIIIFVLSMIFSLVCTHFGSVYIDGFKNKLLTSEVGIFIEFFEWLEVGPNFLGVPLWYGALSFIYNKWAWKWSMLRRLHNVPDLNGKWVGSLTSSYNGQTIPMEMFIEQTWNKISFKSVFTQTKSNSYSNAAAIYVDSNNGIEISFAFRNTSYSVQNNMQSYIGYNILNLVGENKIIAQYMNNRDNPNHVFKGGNKGTFELERV